MESLCLRIRKRRKDKERTTLLGQVRIPGASAGWATQERKTGLDYSSLYDTVTDAASGLPVTVLPCP